MGVIWGTQRKRRPAIENDACVLKKTGMFQDMQIKKCHCATDRKDVCKGMEALERSTLRKYYFTMAC